MRKWPPQLFHRLLPLPTASLPHKPTIGHGACGRGEIFEIFLENKIGLWRRERDIGSRYPLLALRVGTPPAQVLTLPDEGAH